MIIGIPDETGTDELPIIALFNVLDTALKLFSSKNCF